MSPRLLYAGIVLAAVGAGTLFWHLDRPAGPPRATPATIGPAALYAASFTDLQGRTQSLGKYQGRWVLLNFWATWCAPCREEMPALSDAAREWQSRGAAIVGLSSEPAEVVAAFAARYPVAYELGTGEGVDELSRRLGDTAKVLPYSALIAPDGRVVAQKVGPYTNDELRTLFR